MSGREFTNWRGLSPPPRFALMQFSRSVRCTVYQASSRGYDWRSGLGGRRGKSPGCTLLFALENENAKQWIDKGRAKQRGSSVQPFLRNTYYYNLLDLFRKGTKIYAKKVATFPFASPPPIIAILFFALKVRTDSHTRTRSGKVSLPSASGVPGCISLFPSVAFSGSPGTCPIYRRDPRPRMFPGRKGAWPGQHFLLFFPLLLESGRKKPDLRIGAGTKRGEEAQRGQKEKEGGGRRGRRSCSPRGGERNFHLPSGGCRYKKVKGSGIRDFAPPPRPLFANRKSGGERESLTSRFLFFPFYVHEFA